MRTFTLPNGVTTMRIEGIGHVAITLHWAHPLASYPARWNNQRIPTMAEFTRDAAWIDATGNLLHRTHAKQSTRRFTGEPITGFGSL